MNHLKYVILRLKQEIEIKYLQLKNIYLDWKIRKTNHKLLEKAIDDEEKELLDLMSKEQKAYLVDYKIMPMMKGDKDKT